MHQKFEQSGRVAAAGVVLGGLGGTSDIHPFLSPRDLNTLL